MTNIGDLKAGLSAFIAMAEKGEEIEVRKRNVPVAHIIGVGLKSTNQTQLGFAKGTVVIKGDLTESLIPPDQWSMLKGDRG